MQGRQRRARDSQLTFDSFVVASGGKPVLCYGLQGGADMAGALLCESWASAGQQT